MSLAIRRHSIAFAGLGLALLPLAAPPPANAGGDPDAWANPRPEQPEVLLVRGATIWTNGADGKLEAADLLVRQGRIAAVGRGLAAPDGAVVLEAAGRHVTPGLIDAHSHTAAAGGINEGSSIVTAEVAIEDVLDPEDINIYRQIAGGVTTANVLHGSANAIGGKNAVIKLRWGADAPELLFEGAPPGIKFALGENPKRSNFGRDRGEPRYPQTRMGVEQAIREAFLAALDYRRRLQEAEIDGDRVPPRRDLRLEALLEVLDGERRVHAHSYRADEILMLLRVAEDLGFQVSTFQHVLEGYKVADEIAAHGAGASSFSDWWAYKYEVVDAIPYNGALMAERGVVVSFNSDSDELARRLNLEAAKAVRYGGMSEIEALKLVTLNPAIQLGIEDRVGSLEVGKDADFVIWSGDPLSTYSIALETWIDGRRYFDREQDLARRQEVAAEREALLKKVQQAKDSQEESGDGKGEKAGKRKRRKASKPEEVER